MAPKRWMLSVGVSDYGSQPALPDLPRAVNDAARIFQTLHTEYNFQGRLLVHGRDLASGPHRGMAEKICGTGTQKELLDQIDVLRPRMSVEDVFVFFFAGHSDMQGSFSLLPYGAARGDLKSGLPFRELLGALAGLPCREVLLLLNCEFPRQLAFAPPATENAERNTVLLAAGALEPVLAGRRSNSPYSPFAASVDRYLREEWRCGDALSAGQLLAFLRQEGCGSSVLHESPARSASIGTGLVLRRPRLRIRVAVPPPPCAGKAFAVTLSVEDPGGGVAPSSPRLHHRKFLPDGSLFWTELDPTNVCFERAGDYELDCVATDPETGEKAVRSILVSVGDPVEEPFALDPARLPPCRKGEAYEERITITGGRPPYGNLEISGTGASFLKAELHQGTSALDRPCVILRGFAKEHPLAGTPGSPDDAPTAYDLRLSVCDALEKQVAAHYRLLVFSLKDYCLISGGKFEVGYRANLEQNRAIAEMLTDLARKVTTERLVVPMAMQQMVREVGRGLADNIVREIAQDNSGAEVELPEFFVRRYPITNRAWRAYVNANVSTTPPPFVPPQWSGGPPHYFEEAAADVPVVNVEYEHICAYLRWKGTRLPTAWEWERAARGTTGKLFPWGDRFDSSKCNIRESGNGALTLVNKYDQHRSPDGVCDMVGNAAEWVDRRVFSGGYLCQPFRGGSFRDLCLYALPMRDSMEVGIRYGTDEDNPEVGETAFDWLSFRDVIDLDPDPQEKQALVEVPEMCLKSGGHETHLPPFAMARYAVSNLEYWEFVRATRHPRPENWKLPDDPPFPPHHRHLPVVHVTYRDALAFCFWKSRLERRLIRLPTPEQWLAAVDGGVGSTFPWGMEFNLQHCNSIRSGWGKRLPVFALRAGRSKQGLYNLVGNVCEWITPLEVRGGSWQDDGARAAEAGFRFGVQQTIDGAFQRNDVGFRYVALERKGMNRHG